MIKQFGPDLTPHRDVGAYFGSVSYTIGECPFLWGLLLFVLLSCYASVSALFHICLLPLPPSLTSGWRLTCLIGWTTLAPTTKAISITMTKTPPLAPVTPVHTDMEPMSITTITKLRLIEAWFEASLAFGLTHLLLHSSFLNLEFAVSFTATGGGLFFICWKSDGFHLLILQLINKSFVEICLSIPLP